MFERTRGRLGRRGPRLGAAALVVTTVAGGLWWGLAGGDWDGAVAAQGARAGGSEASPTASPSAAPSAAPSIAPSAAPTAAPTPASRAGSASNVPDQTPVAPRKEVVLPAVGLAEPASFGNKVSARLTTSVRVEGKGQGVGERSGPSLLVTVEITNSSAAQIDLDYIVVNLYGSHGAPGQLLLGDGRSAPMSGKLASKTSRTGTYVLRLPDPTPDTVTVTVNYGAQAPTAVFTGKVRT